MQFEIPEFVQIWHYPKEKGEIDGHPICFRHAVENIVAGRNSTISRHVFRLRTESEFPRCTECQKERDNA